MFTEINYVTFSLFQCLRQAVKFYTQNNPNSQNHKKNLSRDTISKTFTVVERYLVHTRINNAAFSR